jgi:23S rRNA (guanosine2251-2'-O)-methyltransferase
MTVQRYQIRQCEKKECHFRFPVVEGSTAGDRCPQCGGKARLIHIPFAAHEVEIGKGVVVGAEVEALLDNIRSVFNVGNMLRTADGAGLRHMHLCGITPTPNNPKLAKTALGAERSVPWTQHKDGVAAAISLREQGLRLWALEGGSRSESLFEIRVDPQDPPIVLVVGSEISGIDPGILELCQKVLCLPMQGVKNTLNVAVAFGVAAYFLRFALGENLRGVSHG